METREYRCRNCGVILTRENSYYNKTLEVFKPHSAFCAIHEREENLKYKKANPEKIKELNFNRWKKATIRKPYRLWVRKYPDVICCRMPGNKQDWKLLRINGKTVKFSTEDSYNSLGYRILSELDQFRLDRRMIKILGRSVMHIDSTKFRRRVENEETIYDELSHSVRHEWAFAKCTFCGHDEVRYDEHGYPYCCKCFGIQGTGITQEEVKSTRYEEASYSS